jgi:hypothetical protein
MFFTSLLKSQRKSQHKMLAFGCPGVDGYYKQHLTTTMASGPGKDVADDVAHFTALKSIEEQATEHTTACDGGSREGHFAVVAECYFRYCPTKDGLPTKSRHEQAGPGQEPIMPNTYVGDGDK